MLTLIERVTQELRLDYFVTGAMARDVLLYHVFGLETGRATLDVDLAVAVDSWPEFERIKMRLVETGAVITDETRPHRLFYRATSDAGRYPLDLLPFGGLEQRPSEIAWPPDLSVVMNVAGYREALAAAEQVELRVGLVVRVASLPSLAILKLFARPGPIADGTTPETRSISGSCCIRMAKQVTRIASTVTRCRFLRQSGTT